MKRLVMLTLLAFAALVLAGPASAAPRKGPRHVQRKTAPSAATKLPQTNPGGGKNRSGNAGDRVALSSGRAGDRLSGNRDSPAMFRCACRG